MASKQNTVGGEVTIFDPGVYQGRLESNEGGVQFGDLFNIRRDFQARGDGLTDDTLAFKNLASNAPNGSHIYIPPGNYKINDTVTFPQPNISIFGGSGTRIFTPNTFQNGNVFAFTGGSVLDTHGGGQGLSSKTLKDLWFDNFNNVARAGGAYVFVDPGPGLVGENTRIIRSVFSFGATAVDLERSNADVIHGSAFYENSTTGIIVDNKTNPDAGDSSIIGCIFVRGAGCIGVLQRASGGLKIVGNKFNVLSIGYSMNISGSTSVLTIGENSFENCSVAGIRLESSNPALFAFSLAAITGNQMSINATNIGLSTLSAGGWLDTIEISGNVIGSGANGIVADVGVVRLGIDKNKFGPGVGTPVNAPSALVDLHGTGVPALAAANGSIFHRTDGGAGSTLYSREAGVWVAK